MGANQATASAAGSTTRTGKTTTTATTTRGRGKATEAAIQSGTEEAATTGECGKEGGDSTGSKGCG